MPKRALITGITGQDDSSLAEYLLAQGYEVWGRVQGQSNPRVRRVRQLLGEARLVTMMVESGLALLSGPEAHHDDSFGPEGW